MSESRDILEEVQRLIAELESYPDAAVGARLTELLQGIDAIHRTALTHLVTAIQSMAGEAFINRLTADPAIRLLLMSYDLIAVDRRLHTEEALDTVRGHLHDHGIDVELSEVVGGAVYVKLHGLERSGVALEAVRHDLEEALKTGLVGFQELVVGNRATARPVELLQVGGLRRAQRPVYRRVGHGIGRRARRGESRRPRRSRCPHRQRRRRLVRGGQSMRRQSLAAAVQHARGSRAPLQLARLPLRRADRPTARRPGADRRLSRRRRER